MVLAVLNDNLHTDCSLSSELRFYVSVYYCIAISLTLIENAYVGCTKLNSLLLFNLMAWGLMNGALVVVSN